MNLRQLIEISGPVEVDEVLGEVASKVVESQVAPNASVSQRTATRCLRFYGTVKEAVPSMGSNIGIPATKRRGHLWWGPREKCHF